MPKWAVYENKQSGNRWRAAVFYPEDEGHPEFDDGVFFTKAPTKKQVDLLLDLRTLHIKGRTKRDAGTCLPHERCGSASCKKG